jgi:hypothetical protein
VDATSRRSREASFDGADGVVWLRNLWTTPPRLRELMLLRDFFLIAQPPLLIWSDLSRWTAPSCFLLIS